MTRVYLSVTDNGSQATVRIDQAERESGASRSTPPERTSPLFPVVPNAARVPATQDFWIGFFYYEQAFVVIGEALSELDDERQGELWYSHGLATPLIISPDRSSIDSFRKEYSSRLRALEIWEIRNGKRVDSSVWLCPTAGVDNGALTLGPLDELDVDTRSLLSQLQQSLLASASAAAQYFPCDLDVFTQIVDAANETIAELLFLRDPSTTPPASFSSDVAESIRLSDVDRQQRIHQRVGDLVQMNSTLSYVFSQFYSGRPPILRHPSPFIPYQLLGVGTAARALSALCRFVEDRFAQHPICKTVQQEYRLLRHVEEYVKIAAFEPDVWRGYAREERLDDLLGAGAPEKVKPRLVYFSNRLGFRESEFTLTAAAQVLELCCTARWSLITMSHELVHAHVRSLLAVIFSGPAGTSTTSAFGSFHDSFVRSARGDHTGAHLIDSLRTVILNYCRWRPTIRRLAAQAKSSGGRVVRESSELPDATLLRDDLAANFRVLNEIMVHVLDYYYFYDGDTAKYVTLLWESWATVPAVLEHLDEYLLRTLIPLSTKGHGPTVDRLSYGIAELRRELEAVVANNPTSAVAREALRRLSDGRVVAEFAPEFTIGSYLAELTRHFLLSPSMEAALREGDKNVDAGGARWTYRLEAFSFPGVCVTSPVAFLVDRLTRASNGENAGADEEALSAWMLLACASAQVPR